MFAIRLAALQNELQTQERARIERLQGEVQQMSDDEVAQALQALTGQPS